jgi:hypothetical protein
VRRRYSDFVWLREVLSRENPRIKLPELPPKRILASKFSEQVVNERLQGLELFLKQ